MTLNITVISPHGIHQSADFRLTDIEQDASGNWKALVDNSPKVITVSDETWEGFITYCGMGMWSHKQTYQFVADWLCSEKPRSLSFDETCEILQKEGSRWIGEIERCVRRFQGHTFIVGGFDRGTPRVEIISNYESTKGKIPRLMGGRLSRSSLSTATVPHVIVTGLDNAVGQEDRLLLKRLVKAKVEHNVIRDRLGRINSKASQSLQAKNGVSEPCLCYSIDRHGAGQGDITGKIKGEFKPLSHHVRHEHDRPTTGVLAPRRTNGCGALCHVAFEHGNGSGGCRLFTLGSTSRRGHPLASEGVE